VLADYDRRFADRLAVASAAANGRPALALPSRIGECRRCAWWPVCSAELTATQDISLVVAGDDVNVLHAAGIRTAGQLADADPAVIAALPLTGSNAATARVRARAWLAGLPLVRKVEQVHVPRADLELDVDMESFLEDGAYLWGTYLSGPAVQRLGLTSGYRGFVTWRPLPDQDEGRAFAEFWAYLAGLRTLTANHGLTFAAYCYSRSAEERWLRSTPLRYPQVAGMPTPEEIAEFCSSPEWVDIYQEIKDQFVVPGSMKLKVLAPVAGFGWRDPDPGGENSMAWYRDAVGPAAGAGSVAGVGAAAGPIDRDSADRILRYNEDDVLATLALRRWLTDRAGEVPSVADLDAD
jgi:predicted RecB family nuclease